MKKSIFRSTVLSLLTLFSIMAFPNPGLAQEEFPSKPIQIHVGFPAGGATDLVTRFIANIMPKYIGKSIIVQNKPGSLQLIAAEFVTKQPQDGYNLFTILEPDFGTRLIMEKGIALREEDFIPIGSCGYIPFILVTGRGRPWTDIEKVISYAKENPGKMSYGSIGPGSQSHLIMEDFNFQTGTNITHIPFKGAIPRETALMGGHIDLSPSSLNSAGPQIKAGFHKALVIFSEKRHPDIPEIPTFQEKGYKGVWTNWYKLTAPKGTPDPIIEKLRSAFRKTMGDPEMREQLKKAGIEYGFYSPEECLSVVKKEVSSNEGLLKKLKLIE